MELLPVYGVEPHKAGLAACVDALSTLLQHEDGHVLTGLFVASPLWPVVLLNTALTLVWIG